jgi:hypothetical protein
MMKAIVLAVLWATVIWRLPAVRRPGQKRSLWLALTCLAIALTVDLPWTITAIDQVVGVTDLSTLIKHLMALGACTALLDWTIASSAPERLRWHVRRRYLIAASVGIALAVLFFATPRAESTDFTESAAGNSWAISYLVVFEFYLGYAMLVATQMFHAAWQDAHSRFLRFGCWLLMTGTGLGTLYAGSRITTLLLSLVTGSMPAGNEAATSITDSIQLIAIIFILLGLAVPACETGWRTAHGIADLLLLRPLWTELTLAAPQVLFFERPTLSEDIAQVHLLGLRLVRRAMEIRDASLHLRTYVTDEQRQQIRARLDERQLAGEHMTATTEACLIGVGLRSKAQGTQPGQTGGGDSIHGGRDITSDIRWLRKVAAARRSALVRTIERGVVPATDIATDQSGSSTT